MLYLDDKTLDPLLDFLHGSQISKFTDKRHGITPGTKFIAPGISFTFNPSAFSISFRSTDDSPFDNLAYYKDESLFREKYKRFLESRHLGSFTDLVTEIIMGAISIYDKEMGVHPLIYKEQDIDALAMRLYKDIDEFEHELYECI